MRQAYSLRIRLFTPPRALPRASMPEAVGLQEREFKEIGHFRQFSGVSGNFVASFIGSFVDFRQDLRQRRHDAHVVMEGAEGESAASLALSGL